MIELDIMRGFPVPHAERRFMLVDNRTLKTTESGERNTFLETIPAYIGTKYGEHAIVSEGEGGNITVKASEEAIQATADILRVRNFPERSADKFDRPKFEQG